MGQAEKMMEETKAKAAELQEMAMEKVNNCKVSWITSSFLLPNNQEIVHS